MIRKLVLLLYKYRNYYYIINICEKSMISNFNYFIFKIFIYYYKIFIYIVIIII
jgi:hypothetical protein